MTNLIAAYQRNEILEFEKILKVKYIQTSSVPLRFAFMPKFMILYSTCLLLPKPLVKLVDIQSNRRTIMDDPFIRNYIEDLLKNIRTQVLLKLIKPYTRIRIPFISKVAITSSMCLCIREFLFPAILSESFYLGYC